VFLVVTQVLPAMAVAVPAAVAVLLGRNSIRAQDLLPAIYLGALTLTVVSAVGFSWMVLHWVAGPDWPRRLALRRPGLGHVVLTLIGFPAVLVLVNFYYHYASEWLPSVRKLGIGNAEDVVSDLLAQWPWPVALLLIGLGPALGEELWFRGFLGRGLVGRYGVAPGVLLTAMFFGAMHLDPPQATAAALLGVALHLVYMAGRSWWLAALLHFLNNSVAVLVLRWAPADRAASAETPGPLALAGAICLFGAVAWAMYRSRARLAPGGAMGWLLPYPGVEYPPGGSGTTVIHPRVGWRLWLVVAAAAGIFVLSLRPSWNNLP
jgi:membrane protease YdiL (CAAX protease family)